MLALNITSDGNPVTCSGVSLITEGPRTNPSIVLNRTRASAWGRILRPRPLLYRSLDVGRRLCSMPSASRRILPSVKS